MNGTLEHNTYRTEQIEIAKKRNNIFFKSLLLLFTSIALFFVAIIIIFVLSKGVSGFFKFDDLKIGDFLFGNYYDGETYFAAGFMVINTLWTTLLAVLIALPISLMTALFVTRVAPVSIRKLLIVIVSILAAVPSVIYGAFGASFLDKIISDVFGILTGSVLTIVITLAFMIMPTITLITISSINLVNEKVEQSSLALGATRNQTSFFITLKSAQKGIVVATILGVGRAMGEATAVSMIATPGSGISLGLFGSIRLLTATMLTGQAEMAPGSIQEASMFAMAALLIITILIVFIALKIAQSYMDEANKSKKATANILTKETIYLIVKKEGAEGLNPIQLQQYHKYLKQAKYEELKREQNFHYYKKEQVLSRTTVTLSEPKSKTYKSHGLGILTGVLSMLGVLSLLFIIIYLLWGGLGVLSWEYVSSSGPIEIAGGTYNGLAPAIFGTILMIVLTMMIAIPLGVLGGMYFGLFAKDTPINKVLSTSIDLLAGVPSLIFGLVGFALFIPFASAINFVPLAGGIIMSFIVLPTIIKTSEDAIKAVPQEHIDGSFGLGSTRTTASIRISLPQAMPQLISGLVLSIGRVIGESAALVMIFGVASRGSIGEWTVNGGTTLATEIYGLTKQEVIPWGLVKAIGIVIMFMVLLLSLLSSFIAHKRYKISLLISGAMVLMLIAVFIGESSGAIIFLVGLIITLILILYDVIFVFDKEKIANLIKKLLNRNQDISKYSFNELRIKKFETYLLENQNSLLKLSGLQVNYKKEDPKYIALQTEIVQLQKLNKKLLTKINALWEKEHWKKEKQIKKEEIK